MNSRKLGLATFGVAALALMTYVVVAGDTRTEWNRAGQANGQMMTITGRVVDLHCFMTGQFVSADHAKCTADCIRQGVPAAIETEQGLVVLGQGIAGPAKSVMPFAYQEVEATGKLFTKGNVKYLDLSSIRAFEDHGENEESDE